MTVPRSDGPHIVFLQKVGFSPTSMNFIGVFSTRSVFNKKSRFRSITVFFCQVPRSRTTKSTRTTRSTRSTGSEGSSHFHPSLLLFGGAPWHLHPGGRRGRRYDGRRRGAGAAGAGAAAAGGGGAGQSAGAGRTATTARWISMGDEPFQMRFLWDFYGILMRFFDGM